MNNGHFNNCHGQYCSCEERRYWVIFFASCAIAGAEMLGSLISGSVSLLADSFHVSFDGAAALAAVVTARLVRRYRAHEQLVRKLSSYLTVLLILGSAAWIVVEAYARLSDPPPIVSGVMMFVAILGGYGNYYQHRFLSQAETTHRTHQLLSFHILTDLWQSIAVVAGGAAIWLTNWYLIDPLLSFLLAAAMVIGLLFLGRHQHQPHSSS